MIYVYISILYREPIRQAGGCRPRVSEGACAICSFSPGRRALPFSTADAAPRCQAVSAWAVAVEKRRNRVESSGGMSGATFSEETKSLKAANRAPMAPSPKSEACAPSNSANIKSPRPGALIRGGLKHLLHFELLRSVLYGSG